MANLVEKNSRMPSDRLLFDYSLLRSGDSDASRKMYLSRHSLEQEVSTSEYIRSTYTNRKSIGTPVKMLIAEEMSKEVDSLSNQPNVVARLMGLDAFPSVNGSHRIYSSIDHEEKSRKEPFRGSENLKKMEFVRQKFSEAKDGKVRNSKQFQDALQVLSSNNDLLLKYLQEPDLVSSVPPPDTRRITVLFPSRISDSATANGHQVEKDMILTRTCSEKISNPAQTTRIVVLKPSLEKANGGIPIGSPHLEPLKQWCNNVLFGKIEDDQNQEPSKDEIGEIGAQCSDDSSFFPPRCSFDYAEKNCSPCSSRSYSQTSYSPDSSVFREAKKRLSVRWATMASDDICPEETPDLRSTTSLGEMLALSDSKIGAFCGKDNDNDTREMEDPTVVVHQLESNENLQDFPRNLMRSKSVPVLDKGMKQHFYLEEAKEKSGKVSFRGLLSNMFSSKNKRSDMQKSGISESHDEALPFSEKPSNSNESRSSIQMGTMPHEHVHSVSKSNLEPSLMSLMNPVFGDKCTQRDLKLNQQGESRASNLLGKSPAIGSIPRTISSKELRRDTASLNPTEEFSVSRKTNEESDWLLFAKTLLSVSGLEDIVSKNSFIERWYSPEIPLDPFLKDKYTDIQDKDIEQDPKRSRIRSTRDLVYDCVNAALLEVAEEDYTLENTNSSLGDKVLGLLNLWFSREVRGVSEGCENDKAVAVVKDEVIGRGWSDYLRVEVKELKKDIAGDLLENIVHEFVVEIMDFTCYSDF